MGYREDYFKAHPGKKRFGRRGRWFKCVSCGKWYNYFLLYLNPKKSFTFILAIPPKALPKSP